MDEKMFYDRYYYLTSCGISYDNKENWEQFFGSIADRIIADINPRTVMDAGCAFGYLVAALRDRGVEAYGIDISDYAIDHVREDIRPYCRVGSVLDPLDRTYDLVVCIEVIEHLPVKDGRPAIENLCKFTSDFIFTSTPFDFKEASHFNVQPTEHWARIFATSGFYRDAGFDASFIINHAIRFRKTGLSIPEVIGDYEKIYFRNLVENKTIREELIQAREDLAHRFNELESSLLADKIDIISKKEIHISNLDTEVAGMRKHIAQLEEILRVKEEYTGYLAKELQARDSSIAEKDQLLEGLNERISLLDEAQLKHLNKMEADTGQLLHQKDEQIRHWMSQVKHLNESSSKLNAELAGQRKSLERLSAQLESLSQLLESHQEEAIGKDRQIRELSAESKHVMLKMQASAIESKETIDEVRQINDTLKRKLADLVNHKNEKDRLLSELNLQVLDIRSQTNSSLVLKSDVIREFDRIKSLKGFKYLMKYYKVRDELLQRTKKVSVGDDRPVTHYPDSPQVSANEPQLIQLNRRSVLEMEREHYSVNPIYQIEFSYIPLVSVVVPLYNTPVDVLSEMIESVLCQTYQHFELCLVDASTSNAEIKKCVDGYRHYDPRIKYREIVNNGIADNTNEAIRMSGGEFIALLDHDDLITPNALHEVVSRLQENPDSIDFFYSDKDMILEDGKTVVNPLYKPSWSPEMMLSANYLTHFCIIRRSVIEASGYLDPLTDGSQDWDIFLKVARLSGKIAHIPNVLYHWRILSTSVASGIGAKPYALEAQLTAIRNDLQARGLTARVEFDTVEKHFIRVNWPTPPNLAVCLVVHHRSNSNALKALLAQLQQFIRNAPWKAEVLVLTPASVADNLSAENSRTIRYQSGGFINAFNEIARTTTASVVLTIDSQGAFEKDGSIQELVEWASQDQYGLITPKIVNKKDQILSIGLAVNGTSVIDMFSGARNVEYTLFGHTEWYRNVSSVRIDCFAVKTDLVRNTGYLDPSYGDRALLEFGFRLRKKGLRNVYTPFSVFKTLQLPDLNGPENQEAFEHFRKLYEIKEFDEYWNSNLLPSNGYPTLNPRKQLKLNTNQNKTVSPPTGWEKYSNDAIYLASAFDFSTKDFDNNRELLANNQGALGIESVNWFLPNFDFIYYAGLYTIFRFANYLESAKGVKNRFIIVGGTDPAYTHDMITEAFPLLKNAEVNVITEIRDVDKLPYADAGICTLWTTAYYLLRFTKTKRKFYFIQDFEPLFYPAGSTFGQTEATYSFGFYGITNTEGIRKIYENNYNGVAIDLKPCIDTGIFYPEKRYKPVKDKFRVFFYGRPGHPRNGFELGSAALRILKSRLGEKVEIYCAGSDWSPAEFGLEGVVTNIGRMDFEKTADLYRVCDVGLVMMFTKHPSYLPFELMACGCAVVSNHNADTKWFLKENVNCVLTEATATRIAENIERLLLDEVTRKMIVNNALADIRNNHTDWNTELNRIHEFMGSGAKTNQ